MRIRDFFVTTISAFLCALFVLLCIDSVGAQVMQSTNYRIQSDSVNFGGGLSTSTQYTLESTAGEIATGDTSSTNYALNAGYQQMVYSTISLTPASAVTMTPSIPGITGGIANGSTTVTVTTDSPSGYQMTISASQSPALIKGVDSITDYVPVGIPDYTFTTGVGDAQFGYSPSGVDTVTRFQDNGSACNVAGGDTVLACWDGLDTVPETIMSRSSANTPDGSTTTIYFRVGIGSAVTQTAGVYTATATLTAISL